MRVGLLPALRWAGCSRADQRHLVAQVGVAGVLQEAPADVAVEHRADGGPALVLAVADDHQPFDGHGGRVRILAGLAQRGAVAFDMRGDGVQAVLRGAVPGVA